MDVPDTFQYIPLLENLQAFLNNLEVLKEVILYIVDAIWIRIFFQVSKSHHQDVGLFGDFCDGSLYKSHPLFSSSTGSGGALCLQFVLYYDDVEVTNPLGSRRGKHKLGKHGCIVVFTLHMYTF